MFFNISCYILEIKNNNLKVKIIDDEILVRFHNNIQRLYSNKKKSINTLQNTDAGETKTESKNNIFTLKINKNTNFDIQNFSYNNISDLIGTHVTISGQSKYYCFEIGESIVIGEKKYKKGYTLVCNKVKSY